MKFGATNVSKDKHEYIIEKDSWSLIVREVELTYDEKENTLIYDGHTLPYLHDDGFCHPRRLTPYTMVWFPDDLCLLFSIHSFNGRMSKIGIRYWLETERFFIDCYNTHTPPSDANSNKTRLSRFEIYPQQRTFCNKPTPLHITQYPDLFISYKEGFNLNTGKRNPLHLPEDDQFIQYSPQNQQITGRIVKDKDKILFPPINSTNNFATIDYDAHVNTNIDYGINHVSKTVTVSELITLRTVCEFLQCLLKTSTSLALY